MGSEVGNRLFRCFSSVFPVLRDEQIRTANLAALLDTDSLAGVNLLAVIDEEFNVDVDHEVLVGLGSFDALQGYLEDRSDPPPRHRAAR